MKQIFLLYIFSSLFLAATSQKKAIEYGLQVGTNLTTAYGNDVIKNNKGSQTGFSIGGNVKINIHKNWGLKTALFYEQNSWSYHSLTFETNPVGQGSVVYKTNYLNLPVLADYSFGNKTKYYFNGGPFLGLLLNNRIIIKEEQPGGNTETSYSAVLNKISFGIAVGGGVKIPLSNLVKLDIGVRNLTGLTERSSGNKVKLNSFSVLAGLSFGL